MSLQSGMKRPSHLSDTSGRCSVTAAAVVAAAVPAVPVAVVNHGALSVCNDS